MPERIAGGKSFVVASRVGGLLIVVDRNAGGASIAGERIGGRTSIVTGYLAWEAINQCSRSIIVRYLMPGYSQIVVK